MKYLSTIMILSLILMSHSCKKKDGLTIEEDQLRLEEQFESIEEMVKNVSCEDESDWDFTAYGSKACGGPVGFIAYPINIKSPFLKAVEDYNQAQHDYNERWGIGSDCSVPVQPNHIRCENGVPVLERL